MWGGGGGGYCSHFNTDRAATVNILIDFMKKAGWFLPFQSRVSFFID